MTILLKLAILNLFNMVNKIKKTIYSAPSVKKAFQILKVIADTQSRIGVSELSKQLKISKSTVHGITSALEELGVLVRDPIDKKYSIGYRLIELGRKAYGRIELREIARIPMERLVEEIGETVFLGIMDGDHVLILDVVEPPNEMKITSPPGTRLPLLAGATGKAFLSLLEEERAKEIVQKIGLRGYTHKSITDPKRYLREVKETKEKGYAIDDEEYLIGVRAVAAPLPISPFPPSAIWLVGFSSRLTDQKMGKAIQEIKKTVQEILHSFESYRR